MKNRGKRYLALLLSVLMTFSTFGFTAFALDGEAVDPAAEGEKSVAAASAEDTAADTAKDADKADKEEAKKDAEAPKAEEKPASEPAAEPVAEPAAETAAPAAADEAKDVAKAVAGGTKQSASKEKANAGEGESGEEGAPTDEDVAPKLVEGPLVYTGEPQALAIAGSSSEGTYYYRQNQTGTKPNKVKLTETDVPKATNVATYYVWYKIGEEGTVKGLGSVSIEKAENSVDVSIDSWNVGEEPSEPVATADFGKETATYKYYDTNSEGATALDNQPTVPGTYYVKAFVEGTKNYKSAESGFVQFRIGSDHTHRFSYTNPETTGIREVTCSDDSNCKYNDVKLKVTAKDKTYDGEQLVAKAEVIGNDKDKIFTFGDVKYYSGASTTGPALQEAPADAGTYTAQVSFFESGVEQGTIWKVFEISPVDVTVTEPEGNDPLVYNGEDQQLIKTPGSLDCEAELPEGAKILYALEDEEYTEDPSEIIGKDAGSYTISWKVTGFEENGNYKFDENETEGEFKVTIDSLKVTIKADDKTKYVGQPEPEYTYTVMAGDTDVTEMFKNDVPSMKVGRTSTDENAGTYRIDKSDYFEDQASNYIFGEVEYGLLTIKGTTDVPEGLDSTYDGKEHELVYASEQADGTSFVYCVSEDEPESDDDYSSDIPVGVDAGEYKVWYKVAKDGETIGDAGFVTATIEQAEITVASEGFEGPYDGERHIITVTASGFCGDDEADIRYSKEPFADGVDGVEDPEDPEVSLINADEKVVYYKVNLPEREDGESNYIFAEGSEATGSESIVISQAELTIKTNDKTITYGEAFVYSDEDYSVEGWLEETDPEVILKAEDEYSKYVKGDTPAVGLYDIIPYIDGSEEVLANYDLENATVEIGVLTVEPRELTIIWTDPEPELVYNGKEQTGPTVKLEGALEEEEITIVIKGDSNKGKDAGEYTAYAELEASDEILKNYTFNEEDLQHDWVIKKAPLTIKSKDATITYGYSAPDFEIETENVGFVEGEDASVIKGFKRFDTEYTKGADAKADPGYKVYPVESTFKSDNYEMTFEVGNLNVEPREVTLKWDQTPLTYNGKEQEMTATIDEGVILDDVLNVRVAPGEGSEYKEKNVNTEEKPYYLAIAELAGTGKDNYKIAAGFEEYNWQIVPADLTVIANSYTINYGDAAPAYSVTFDKLLGDDVSAAADFAKEVKVTSTYAQNAKEGTYDIVVTGPKTLPKDLGNYNVKYVNGKLTVKEKNTVLVAKAVAKGSKKAKLSWNAVTGVASYEIYFAKCNSNGKEYKCKKIKTVSGNKLSFTKKGLKKGTCYKYYVVAKDASGKVISKSLTAHFVAGKYNAKKTNAKSLTVSAKSVDLTVGGTAKLSAKQKKAKSGKKLLNDSHASLLRYTTSNAAVATVSKSGVITAIGKGYCKVYVQAVDGIWQEVVVNVK